MENWWRETNNRMLIQTVVLFAQLNNKSENPVTIQSSSNKHDAMQDTNIIKFRHQINT